MRGSRRVVVLGGGISGLVTAFELRRLAEAAGGGVDVVVLERASRAGGKIRSESAQGFLFEGGPNGYLSSRTAAVELVDRLGLSSRALAANEASARRFVWFDGKLRAIPSSPGAMISSGLLGFGGKLRLACEPFVPGRTYPEGAGDAASDETVAEFGRRRIGAQATARLLDPFLTGIYAGDIERTSVAAAFPKIVALEREFGGLVRGMIGRRKQAKAAVAQAGRGDSPSGERGGGGGGGRGGRGGTGGPSGLGGVLTSFPRGMGELVDGLVGSLGSDALQMGVQVVGVEPLAVAGEPKFMVTLGDGHFIKADAVVCAMPTHAAKQVLGGLGDDRLLGALGGITYAPVAVVGLGYRLADFVRPPDGFGYLTPRSEQRRVLGMLWSHCIFPGARAPEGHGLLRCIVGGVRSPELVALGDDELVEHIRGEVREVLGERDGAAPVFSRVVRWERGIPQYERGHLERVAEVDAACLRAPGLYVGGNGLRGVSLAECCGEGLRLAQQVLASL